MSEVRLSWLEVFQSAIVGVMRRIEALKKNRGDRYGKPQANYWGLDIESAAAEMVVAKSLGVYWHALASDPSRLPGDVGVFQVRSTEREGGCLILHEGDDDQSRFFLVVGRIPSFRIVGSIRAQDGKRSEYWKTGDGRPAYFVPQDALTKL